jgi:hypothetical protein
MRAFIKIARAQTSVSVAEHFCSAFSDTKHKKQKKQNKFAELRDVWLTILFTNKKIFDSPIIIST